MVNTQQNLQRQNASCYVEIWANLGLFNAQKEFCLDYITLLSNEAFIYESPLLFVLYVYFSFSNFILEHHPGFALWLICGMCTNILLLHMRAIQAKFFMTKREHGCHQKQASKKFDDGASNVCL